MTDRSKHRKPATFRLDDANVVLVDTEQPGRPARGTVQIIHEPEPQLPAPIDVSAVPRRGLSWGTLFWGAVAGLVLLGLALGTVNMIEDLFARNEGLGILSIALRQPPRWRSA